MDHSDYTNLILGLIGLAGAFVSWLLVHSSRMTKVETKVENNERRLALLENEVAQQRRGGS